MGIVIGVARADIDEFNSLLCRILTNLMGSVRSGIRSPPGLRPAIGMGHRIIGIEPQGNIQLVP